MLKTDDAMNGAYEDKPGVIDVGVVREDICVPPEFRIGAVIHGSNGSELPKLHEVLLEKEVKEKLSFIFKFELSSFSCLRHFARLFWNQTCK